MNPHPLSCSIFSETYLPLLGGAEMYTYNFAKQLHLRGYTVTIFTHTKGTISDEYKLEGVFVKNLPKVKKFQIFKIFQLYFQIIKIIKKADLIFVNYTYTLSTLVVLGKIFTRKPITVIAHGLGTIIDESHPKIYYFYRFVTLKLADKVITASEEIASIVKNFGKPVLIATGVDFNTIDQSINLKHIETIKKEFSEKKIILTVRRLVDKNGIQFLIEAIPFLLKIRNDFVYIIIGDGRLRKELEKRVHELHLLEYIKFFGSIENHLVFDYIKSANVVVFPSSAEALSLAAIEVMHIGTPLLVSNIGGLRELVGYNAERGSVIDLFGRINSVYIPPDIHTLSQLTLHTFAEKLSKCMSESQEIQRKSLLAKQFVDQRFSWDEVINTILNFVS